MPHPNSQGGLPVGGPSSSKSVLDQQDELKHWPDDRLIAEMQNPTGIAPQYLLFTEVNRREDVRKRYEAANAVPNTTMAEELIASKTAPVQPPMPQQPGMGPMPPGGGPMPPPDMGPVDPMSMGGLPPEGMPPGPPMPPMDGGMPMPPGPQGFAYGGLVKGYHDGGSVYHRQSPHPHGSRGLFSHRGWERDPVARAGEELFADEEARAQLAGVGPATMYPSKIVGEKEWWQDPDDPYSDNDPNAPISVTGPVSLLRRLGQLQTNYGPESMERYRMAQQPLIRGDYWDSGELKKYAGWGGAGDEVRAGKYPVTMDEALAGFGNDEPVDGSTKTGEGVTPKADPRVEPEPEFSFGGTPNFDYDKGAYQAEHDELKSMLEEAFADPEDNKADLLLGAAQGFFGAKSLGEGAGAALGNVRPVMQEARKERRENKRGKLLARTKLREMDMARREMIGDRKFRYKLAEEGARASHQQAMDVARVGLARTRLGQDADIDDRIADQIFELEQVILDNEGLDIESAILDRMKKRLAGLEALQKSRRAIAVERP